MGRNKLDSDDSLSSTISFRVSPEVVTRITDAIGEKGVSRSDVCRRLVTDSTDKILACAIKNAQLDRLQNLKTLSIQELKQRRMVALKSIAWIDVQLDAAAKAIDRHK